MGRFEIIKGTNGQYYFHLKAANGEIILSSEGYTRKPSCNKGIKAVKRNSRDEQRFDRRRAVDGSHYFILKAANSRIIGTSEMYTTKAAMENGIASVQQHADESDIGGA